MNTIKIGSRLMKLPRISLLLIALLMALPASQAVAEKVGDIQVVGNERVEKSTVLNYLPFNVGSKLEADDISRTVKRLYATGLFSHVDIKLAGQQVTIEVTENPKHQPWVIINWFLLTFAG